MTRWFCTLFSIREDTKEFSNHYSAVKELGFREQKTHPLKMDSVRILGKSPIPYNQPNLGLHKSKIEQVCYAVFKCKDLITKSFKIIDLLNYSVKPKQQRNKNVYGRLIIRMKAVRLSPKNAAKLQPLFRVNNGQRLLAKA